MIYVALAERTATELITGDKALRNRLVHLPWVLAPEQAIVESRPAPQ
jgi:hypothetical protein